MLSGGKLLLRTMSTDKFYYFAFGSNLLTERIHIKNPSAVQKSVGKVDKYKLAFGHYSKRWKGEVATIIEDPHSTVYGVIWELHKDHQETLDRQEEVPRVYRKIYVEVNILKCLVYQMMYAIHF